MPAFSTQNLTDREATPVAHSFTPSQRTNAGVAVWKLSDGVPIGDSTLSVSSKVAGNGNRKVRVTLALPTTVDETINGVVIPSVARTAYADLTLTFDPRSTVQERMNLVGMVESILAEANTDMDSVLVGLESVYG